MKILVVGGGSIGHRHAKNARKFSETSIVDINKKTAKNCARKLKIKAFESLSDGLAWNPDGVIVATPTYKHMEIAEKAIDAGADVLIEKPISNTTMGLKVILQRAKKRRRKIYVVCNMRFHPAVSILQNSLYLIGQPFYARAHVGSYLPNMRPSVDYRKLYCSNRNQGGGVLFDSIHELDYLMCFFGDVTGITCIKSKLSKLKIDVEDYACLCLQHEKSIISEIQMDYLRPFKRRGCEIVGEEGILLWESEGKNPEIINVRFYSKKNKAWKTLLYEDNFDTNSPYKKMIEHFTNALAGKKVPLLKGRMAATELEIMLKAHEQKPFPIEFSEKYL